MTFRLSFPLLALAAVLVTLPAGAADPGPVRLIPRADLGTGLAAFPRLAADDAPSRRINQALDNADARVLAAVKACRGDAADSQADPKDVEWGRTVTVAMRGPGYLALLAGDEWFCGGPYPDTGIIALTYDLRTGSPVNWVRLLPKTLVGTASLDTAEDGARIGVLASPALQALYREIVNPDSDCAPVLKETELRFTLWPDAERGGVGVKPINLPHVVAACGEDAVIPIATLRKLGADPWLLAAIIAAHDAGLYGMKQ